MEEKTINDINCREWALVLMNKYSYLKDNYEKFIMNLPLLFLQDWINLYEEIQEKPNFLGIEDDKLFEIIVFNTLVIHTYSEEDLWDMRDSGRVKRIQNKLRKEIIEYMKNNVSDNEQFFDTLKNLCDKKLSNPIFYNSNGIVIWNTWTNDLCYWFSYFIVRKIENGTFFDFDIEQKCNQCQDNFIIIIEEQKWYKNKGFNLPKKCKYCRRENKNTKYSKNFHG
jgi:hypothetical protein